MNTNVAKNNYSQPSNVTKFYDKIAKKKGKQIVVAAASKLLKIVYWVMKERREYHG
ncbi:MAG: hypothetical protein QXU32_10375 [Nitrososphaerales archaeon]